MTFEFWTRNNPHLGLGAQQSPMMHACCAHVTRVFEPPDTYVRTCGKIVCTDIIVSGFSLSSDSHHMTSRIQILAYYENRVDDEL